MNISLAPIAHGQYAIVNAQGEHINSGTEQRMRAIFAEVVATEAIEIAARCSSWGVMASSAQSCLDDAVWLTNRGQHADAYNRALESLRYSVGIFGESYKAAKALRA